MYIYKERVIVYKYEGNVTKNEKLYGIYLILEVWGGKNNEFS